MFKKILIANRSEIAVRIIRACKELGIKSAAVYSEADKTALHPRLADEAHLIGPAQSSESYLNADKIILLAKKIKADAIHPGYGFFSENAAFIKKVEDSGLVFIGPSSSSVKMMGSKTAARTLMQKNKVPIVPGTTKPVKNIDEALAVAGQIGYPVLLKASAGGGGKGMRKVSDKNQFKEALEATQREALKAFSDEAVYIEKYIENPKHIEVQIIADKHGNYRHLFERECSAQRRHQKIIEEAPSASVDETTRNKLTGAAINAAKACNYFNAGTIEFLMDKNRNFYFLEMNTRLQVEHPVTELITGVDLVKEQISVAAGNKISFNQEDLKINGHAVECRIYAEDAENNFLPSTGRIYEYNAPSGPGVRVDSGFEQGSEISVYYDPLIAKLICWNNSRQQAVKRCVSALEEFNIAGVTNNIQFLKAILLSSAFNDASFNINFIESELLPEYQSAKKMTAEEETAAAVFAALMKEQNRSKNLKTSKNRFVNKWTSQLYE